MQIINPNDYPITIPRNHIVATVSYVHVDSIQTLSDLPEDKNKKKSSNEEMKNKSNDKSKNKNKINFNLSSADISDNEKKRLLRFLEDNRSLFASDLTELRHSKVYKHEIQTTHEIPLRTPPYRASPDIKQEIDKLIF